MFHLLPVAKKQMSHRACLVGLNSVTAKSNWKNVLAESTSHVPLLWLLLFRSENGEIPSVEREDALRLLDVRMDWLCKLHVTPDQASDSAAKLRKLVNGLRWKFLQLEFSDLCDGRFEKAMAAAIASLDRRNAKSRRQLEQVCLDEAFTKAANDDILIGYSSTWYPPKLKTSRKPKPSLGPKGWKVEKLARLTRYHCHNRSKTWLEVEAAMEKVWIDFLRHVEAFEAVQWDKIFMICDPSQGWVTFRVDARDHFRTSFPESPQIRFEFRVTIDLVKLEFEQAPEFQGRGHSYYTAVGRIQKKLVNAIKMATSAQEVIAVIRSLNKKRRRKAFFNVTARNYYSGISEIAIPARRVSGKV